MKKIVIGVLVVAGGLLLAVATSPLWIDRALEMNGCQYGVCSWLSTEVEFKRHAAKDSSQ